MRRPYFQGGDALRRAHIQVCRVCCQPFLKLSIGKPCRNSADTWKSSQHMRRSIRNRAGGCVSPMVPLGPPKHSNAPLDNENLDFPRGLTTIMQMAITADTPIPPAYNYIQYRVATPLYDQLLRVLSKFADLSGGTPPLGISKCLCSVQS